MKHLLVLVLVLTVYGFAEAAKPCQNDEDCEKNVNIEPGWLMTYGKCEQGWCNSNVPEAKVKHTSWDYCKDESDCHEDMICLQELSVCY